MDWRAEGESVLIGGLLVFDRLLSYRTWTQGSVLNVMGYNIHNMHKLLGLEADNWISVVGIIDVLSF